MERRFEQTTGNSEKFWEIQVSGSTHTVRFGRLGTSGQTTTKSFASPKAAKDDALRRIRAKLSKGYEQVRGTKARVKKSAAKKTAAKKTAAKKTAAKKTAKTTAEQSPVAVIRGHREGSIVGLYLDGKSLYFALLGHGDDGLEDLSRGEPVGVLEDEDLERWTFGSPAEAKKTATALARAPASGTRLELPRGGPNLALAPLRASLRQAVPTLGAFRKADKGPVTLAVNTPGRGPRPRPPSHCAECGRPMMTTYALEGMLDRRLGKKTSLFVSFCPGAMATPHCPGAVEVVVCTPELRSHAEHYMMWGRDYYFLFLSKQVNPIGRHIHWVVTEHNGSKGLPGFHRSQRFGGRKAAEAHIKQTIATHTKGDSRFKPVEPSAIRGWYRELLAEMHHFYRCEDMNEAKTLRFAPTHGPMDHGIDTYGRICEPVAPRFDVIGGAPWYIQAESSHRPQCSTCNKPMMFVFQVGEGDAHYASHVNTGDVGAFYIFVCPRCRGPFGHAEFECH